MARASEWELRVMHEAAMHERNCFVTLTYAPGKLPPHGSLHHPDFQGFMKRLRTWKVRHEKSTDAVRFFMCGEYGEENARAHYHACLFNQSFDDQKPMGKSGSGRLFYDSEILKGLWGFGHVSVQPLVKETAGYCTRYIMKKVLGDEAESAYSVVDEETGEIVQRKPPYAAMSLKPGIGANWFKRYGRDVFPHDFAIIDGSKRPVPKYYARLAEGAGEDLDDIKYRRELRRRERASEETDERREVREVVHQAKVRTLVRRGL